MKKITLLIILLFPLLVQAQLNDYENLWANVERFEIRDFPKSALTHVEQILQKAITEDDVPQQIKCFMYQAKFALILEEDAQLKIIDRLKEAIKNSKKPTTNILQSILAELYSQYYSKHRYQFNGRTKTDEKVDKQDFRTWDLETLYLEIHKQYQNSLAHSEILQSSQITAYEELINLKTDTKYRPTLYDFLAHRALNFYENSSVSYPKQANSFEIDETYLISIKKFNNLVIKHQDSLSKNYNALVLYQKLSKSHTKNKQYAALLLNTSSRLKFIKDKLTHSESISIYRNLLEKIIHKYKKSKAITILEHDLAKSFYDTGSEYNNKTKKNQWDKKKAIEICREAIAKNPVGFAAENCRHLMGLIQEQKSNVTFESYIPIQKKTFAKINYKNTKSLWFSIYKTTEQELIEIDSIYNNRKKIAYIRTLKKIKHWNVSLQDLGDYNSHSTEIVMPALSNGKYILINDIGEDNSASYNFFQVTDMTIINSLNHGNILFQVVNRNTGKPFSDINVDIIRFGYRKNIDSLHLITDKNGYIYIEKDEKNTNYHNYQLSIKTNTDQVDFGKKYIYSYNYYSNKEEVLRQQFKLFTDRGIYRPGQKVYFKGIATEQKGSNIKVLAGVEFEIILNDANGEELKVLELKTNEFGSVFGSFDLPKNGLNGEFTIEYDSYDDVIFDDLYDEISFRVEEYKRPKFEASFDKIKETFRVNDTATVTGTATAFSGAKISDAKVVYRVKREVQYPRWYYWYYPNSNSSSQEITHGKTLTDNEGNFKIDFLAIPDTSVSKTGMPIFNYTITADITDINGETHSTKTTVRIGYHTMEAQLYMQSKIDKTETNQKIDLAINNLNGEKVNTKGKIKIYKVQAPQHVYRPRPWTAPDLPSISKEAFNTFFPNDVYTNEDEVKNQKDGTLVFESNFDTAIQTSINLGTINDWQSGKYHIVLNTKDEYDNIIKDEIRFDVYSPKDKKVADNKLFDIKIDKTAYTPKDKVNLTIATASTDLWVNLWVDKKGVIKKRIIHLSNEIKHISIPIKEKDRGGFSIHYSWVNINTADKGTIDVAVPYKSHDLTITTNTFRNKLQPGQDETWSFTLKGTKGEKVAAELLANMYDQSLDEFVQHDYRYNPFKENHYYRHNNFDMYGFGTYTNDLYFKNNYFKLTYLSFSKLEWFGFSFNDNWQVQNAYMTKIKDINRYKTVKLIRKTGIQGEVCGIVTDDMGPIPGASVLIKGTNNGTVTDFDGNYCIMAQNGDTLVFSMAGNSIEKIVQNTNIVDAEIAVAMLEGVTVVTALGVKSQRSVSYAVQTIKSEDISISAEKTKETAISEEDLKALASVKARKNFNETAFFLPTLRTNEKGEIRFSFTMPEALTTWKLQLLAHTKDLKVGTKTLSTVTQKDLMVIPNVPRFLREGDSIVISSKITNLTSEKGTGFAQLVLTNALDGKSIDNALANTNATKNFNVDAKGNTSVSWKLFIPKGTEAVQWKIVAKMGKFTDGEQNVLPVLSNRMLVTESMAMWVKQGQTKTFSLDKLKNNSSNTLSNHKLTLEITSNPAWYAVQSLPYLMEYPHECAEQTFSRYYANALATHIANSNPKIQEVFSKWENTDALISNLEKNQDLKNIIIQETPWLRDAQSESEQKKRMGLLFNLDKMSQELKQTANKLSQMQHSNGGFPWFKGSRYESRYITQHVANGFGHLKQLGVVDFSDETAQMLKEAVSYLDNKLITDYQYLLRNSEIFGSTTYLSERHLGSTQMHYLYMRSFYKDIPTTKALDEAINYYTKQTVTYWKDYRSIYNRGLMALYLHRGEHQELSKEIVKSLDENSITNEEMGMYWKSNRAGYYWYQAPIETQALMIEVFSEIDKDLDKINNLKLWLLKNKQTTQWKTTKATTEAIYALLLQGSDWLSINETVAVQVGNQIINPNKMPDVKVEAGTGYFKKSWKTDEIKPKMAQVTLTKKEAGVAWGGLYWQYFEDLDKITQATEGKKAPLFLTKKVFLKKNTDTGEALTLIDENTTLKVGDLVRIRIELRADREMEFIHMKDMRAAGLEPVNVISQYKWQDGLGYYESTKDASTNFFISNLPIGVYVFEYDLRVNNAGNFSNGITTIQSMYAPEFSSHSEGVRLKID